MWTNQETLFPEGGQTRKHCFLAMFHEGGQTRKHCFLAMFPEGRQTRKHCFLTMFPEGGQTRKHCFLAMLPKGSLNQTNNSGYLKVDKSGINNSLTMTKLGSFLFLQLNEGKVNSGTFPRCVTRQLWCVWPLKTALGWSDVIKSSEALWDSTSQPSRFCMRRRSAGGESRPVQFISEERYNGKCCKNVWSFLKDFL
jgi:hypothetical protein